MRVIFVRHGETVENREHILQGHLHGRLTDAGIKQAKEVAIKLKDEKIDYIYSSDLARAADTAKEIAKFHPDVPLVLTDALRERNIGTWQGKKYDDIGWTFEANWEPGKRQGGGETLEEVYERMEKFAKELFKKHKNETVLIVGHGFSGMMLVGALMGKKIEETKEFTLLNNTEVMSFNVTGKSRTRA